MLDVLLTAAVLAQTVQQAAASDSKVSAPTQISSREAYQHAIGDEDRLYLRIDEQDPPFLGIRVKVVVNADGSVISAIASPESQDKDILPYSSLFPQAESMVSRLRFRPFERAGGPVSVTFERYVTLLPPEVRPTEHAPFPKVKDWKSVRITLARTGCFGTCPSYKVEVRGDGSVRYEGNGYVTFTGTHVGSVPPENVIELVKQFEQSDYYSLKHEYSSDMTDNPTQTTSIEIEGHRKEVVDYVGLQSGMPIAVSELERAIDRLSGSARWTRGNADTLAALEAEHWDFKSAQASASLARAAEYGDADVVRDLVRAGVPPTGKAGAAVMSINDEGNSTALQTAATHGDIAMLRALLQAGAGKGPKALAPALVKAAESGNVEALLLLLENGASITSRDSRGRTVLIAAAASGSPAMVKEVLKSHPEVNAPAIPPAPSCTKEAKEEDRCPEFSEGAGQTALMIAAAALDDEAPPEGVDRVEVVRLLLAAGADVNVRDKEGNTALILCCDSADVALLLLKAGADPNARNHEGETALTTNAHDDDVRRILIEHGAVQAAADGEEE